MQYVIHGEWVSDFVSYVFLGIVLLLPKCCVGCSVMLLNW